MSQNDRTEAMTIRGLEPLPLSSKSTDPSSIMLEQVLTAMARMESRLEARIDAWLEAQDRDASKTVPPPRPNPEPPSGGLHQFSQYPVFAQAAGGARAGTPRLGVGDPSDSIYAGILSNPNPSGVEQSRVGVAVSLCSRQQRWCRRVEQRNGVPGLRMARAANVRSVVRQCLCNLDCLHKLESLKLSIQMDKILRFPISLNKLSLKGCHLGWEDVWMMGSLPQLQVLHLGVAAARLPAVRIKEEEVKNQGNGVLKVQLTMYQPDMEGFKEMVETEGLTITHVQLKVS
ncbi:hypothetical protein SASPL_107933 [Salvia splendens]|uniref:Uncharacterized protein n=1 Tax=Salvia splendens TaxID=180675 RepID=A0A8X8YC58_SALSN|nr:hypothetical protein SASPL_107933 [Salvia splendens]